MAGIDQGPNGTAPGCTTYSYVYIGSNTSSSKVGNPLTNQASTSLSRNLLLYTLIINTLKNFKNYLMSAGVSTIKIYFVKKFYVRGVLKLDLPKLIIYVKWFTGLRTRPLTLSFLGKNKSNYSFWRPALLSTTLQARKALEKVIEKK